VSGLIIGLEGPELDAQEVNWLGRPDVVGAILFTRNFVDVDQLRELNHAIRRACEGALITVDQEGGRVQRIGAPCTRLPPLRRIGEAWVEDPDEALELAFHHAWLMASEMRALDIDLSFAPVLDLDRGAEVIGDRAFHGDASVVKELGRAYLKGMADAAMEGVAKHFPGHGWTAADSHEAVAVDERPMDEIAGGDLRPYSVAQRHGLAGVMMAHVIYPAVCPEPAGYSKVWCREVLRDRMRFEGVIVSDDLGMRAAADAGDFEARYHASMEAGCDLALVCRPDDVRRAMERIRPREPGAAAADDLARLRGGEARNWEDLIDTERWLLTRERVLALEDSHHG